MKHGRVIVLLLLTVLMTWGLRLDATYLSSTHCDQDIGGITLAPGFCATVFADHLGVARHMVVDAAGDVYVALQQKADGGGIVALRDSQGTGHADQVKYFGD